MGKQGELPRLGFLGLGGMGGPMVRNLLQAGYRLCVFDIDLERLRASAAAGATAAGAAEVVGASDIVLTSLPSSESFLRVAEKALLPHARAGQIFIETGTTTPHEVRRLAEAFAGRGATLLDVPVSGGTAGAESGTLAMFAGGDRQAFDRCLPILQVLGDPERITYCGPSGAGQVVKGVHQLKSGLVNAAYLEAIAFGVRAGADAATLHRALVGPKDRGGEWERRLAQVEAGQGEAAGVKFRELPYYLDEAGHVGFELPLTRTLHAFCDRGERVVIDDNRPAPSFWHELTKQQG